MLTIDIRLNPNPFPVKTIVNTIVKYFVNEINGHISMAISAKPFSMALHSLSINYSLVCTRESLF